MNFKKSRLLNEWQLFVHHGDVSKSVFGGAVITTFLDDVGCQWKERNPQAYFGKPNWLHRRTKKHVSIEPLILTEVSGRQW